MKKILLIEDDSRAANTLNDLFTKQGYNTKIAHMGAEGVMYFKQIKFDLVVLDMSLPDKAGSEVLEEIRTISTVPVIVLTDGDGKDSMASLLYAGANDYLIKPFYANELLSRMEVQLQMGSTAGGARVAEDTLFHFKDILLDLEQADAFIGGKPLNLSRREFGILKCLMKNPRKAFSKKELYERIWGETFFEDDNTIHEYVTSIRTKMAMNNPAEDYILTVWGSGYKMQD